MSHTCERKDRVKLLWKYQASSYAWNICQICSNEKCVWSGYCTTLLYCFINKQCYYTWHEVAYLAIIIFGKLNQHVQHVHSLSFPDPSSSLCSSSSSSSGLTCCSPMLESALSRWSDQQFTMAVAAKANEDIKREWNNKANRMDGQFYCTGVQRSRRDI